MRKHATTSFDVLLVASSGGVNLTTTGVISITTLVPEPAPARLLLAGMKCVFRDGVANASWGECHIQFAKNGSI